MAVSRHEHRGVFSRRQLLGGLAAGVGVSLAGAAHAVRPSDDRGGAPAGGDGPANDDSAAASPLRFAVKWGMIGVEGAALDRFRVCRELGYDGMELISPGQPPDAELAAAAQQTGMPIHGLVNSRHWRVRLSSPDQATRDAARAILEQCLRDCSAMGGHSVLLVPGVVGGEATHAEVWSRSISEVRRVLPLAARLGVRVLIENVWNGFCEQPEQLRDYLDEIDSPWVGCYFDIGNAQKFAPPAQWVRTLARRIVKLDVKDWGAGAGFCKIGQGDVDWPAVREALADINFCGWCTAEVAGGGRRRLADIAKRMNTVLRGETR